MQISAIKNDYLAYLQYELKVSKTTFTSYKSGLNRFVRFLAQEGMTDPDIETALSIPILRKYNLQLGKKGLAAASVHGAFDPIQSLCVYLVNNDVLEEDPSKKIVLPRRKKTKREIVSDLEVEALFDACERYPKDKDVALSRAILATFCFTGVRAFECAQVKLEDVRLDTDPEMLIIRKGKGDKDAYLYPPSEWVVAIKQWLGERAKMKCMHNYLWAPTQGWHMSDEKIRERLEEIKALAGLKDHDNIKPHALRHWFARNMHRNGATLKQVQLALRHDDIKTTAIYLQGTEEDCKVMNKFAGMPKKSEQGPAAAEAPEKKRAKAGKSQYMDQRRARKRRPTRQ